MNVLLRDFPWPISENKLYVEIPHPKIKSATRKFKSPEAKAFDNAVLGWALARAPQIKDLRTLCEFEVANQNRFICVDAYFGLPPEEMWLKNGAIRQVDASNWIKSLNDNIVRVIGVDDKYFTVGRAEKFLTRKGSGRLLIIRLSSHQIRTQVQCAREAHQEKFYAPEEG